MATIFYVERINLIGIYNISDKIHPQSVDNVGMYLFSFQLLPKLAESTSLHLNLLNSDYIYITVYLFLIVIFLYIIFKNSSLKNKQIYLINLNLNEFEDRLFLISSTMLIAIYFISISYLYKEIYFLGLLPFLRKNFLYKKNFYINSFYILILLKFIMLTLFWVLQTSFFGTSAFIKGFNIFTKGIIDNVLIIFLILLLLKFIKENIKLRLKL